MTFGTYNTKASNEGLTLSDLFGSKLIPWDSIIALSTTNEGGAYDIITSNKSFTVTNDMEYSFEEFGNYVAKMSHLIVCTTAPPTGEKRWTKIGTQYTHANYFDKLKDAYFGIPSKEARTWRIITLAGFSLGLLAIIFGYLSSK